MALKDSQLQEKFGYSALDTSLNIKPPEPDSIEQGQTISISMSDINNTQNSLQGMGTGIQPQNPQIVSSTDMLGFGAITADLSQPKLENLEPIDYTQNQPDLNPAPQTLPFNL